MDPLLLTFFIKIHHAKHYSMIRYGQGVHSQFFCPLYHAFYPRGTVQKAVFGMYMEVSKAH